jgi:hypothetical protein
MSDKVTYFILIIQGAVAVNLHGIAIYTRTSKYSKRVHLKVSVP